MVGTVLEVRCRPVDRSTIWMYTFSGNGCVSGTVKDSWANWSGELRAQKPYSRALLAASKMSTQVRDAFWLAPHGGSCGLGTKKSGEYACQLVTLRFAWTNVAPRIVRVSRPVHASTGTGRAATKITSSGSGTGLRDTVPSSTSPSGKRASAAVSTGAVSVSRVVRRNCGSSFSRGSRRNGSLGGANTRLPDSLGGTQTGGATVVGTATWMIRRTTREASRSDSVRAR